MARSHRLVARVGEGEFRRALLGDVAADALDLAHAAFVCGDDEVLPYEPARPRGGRELHHPASPLVAAVGKARLGRVAADDGKMEHLAEGGVPLHAEGPAERVVDEGETSVGVAAKDDVALVIEQIAVAGLALAHLPLQILEGFEA